MLLWGYLMPEHANDLGAYRRRVTTSLDAKLNSINTLATSVTLSNACSQSKPPVTLAPPFSCWGSYRQPCYQLQ